MTLKKFAEECILNGIFVMISLPSSIKLLLFLELFTHGIHKKITQIYSFFLSKVEEGMFSLVDTKLCYSILSIEEWQAVHSLAGNRATVIKKADKKSGIVV